MQGPGSLARLYVPFLVILLVQALLIAAAPSRPPERAETVSERARGGGPGGSSGGTPTGQGPRRASQGPEGPGTTGASETRGGPSDPADTGAETPDAPTTAGPGPVGDTSHCTPDGRQHGVTYDAPPCVPEWGDRPNGGATYRGVTEDTIKILWFRVNQNPQVTAVLESQGLAASKEQVTAYNDAMVEFLNARYELYGRQVEWELFQADGCPQSPPDPQRCKVAAREAANKDPFAIFWSSPIYPGVFDVWAREGVISLGGWHFDRSAYTKRRPYRYDVFMGGTQAAQVVEEYYCKKLAGKAVSHSGRVIHPEVGARDQTQRQLGIIVPDTETNVATARTVQEGVGACGSEPPMFTFESDINRAQEQARAVIAGLIDAGVTTVVCMCDAITPVFWTNEASNQNYYPEWLLPGINLLDYDLDGRFYDQRQWVHAFGPSHLTEPVPHEQSDSSKTWRATGREGTPCSLCDFWWPYWSLLGTQIQMAGPELTPLTVEDAIIGQSYTRGGWAETGGDPHVRLRDFGPGDYTGLGDSREVIWRPSATSRIDGRPGAYVSLHEGRRYRNGAWPSSFDMPPPSD